MPNTTQWVRDIVTFWFWLIREAGEALSVGYGSWRDHIWAYTFGAFFYGQYSRERIDGRFGSWYVYLERRTFRMSALDIAHKPQTKQRTFVVQQGTDMNIWAARSSDMR